ncbi:NDR1/HIN1-like protein 12 [Setaria italica]|uniref:NDR1/HIN1-like protein 12 n=1 Tax=Setaria italica TaxID=4555 RepID=UPI000BE52A30|nr:NDR1/HIN1-like protein 12 [Setaria italica]
MAEHHLPPDPKDYHHRGGRKGVHTDDLSRGRCYSYYYGCGGGGGGGGGRALCFALLVLLLAAGITLLVLYVVYRPSHPSLAVTSAAVLALYNATANTAGGATALAASFQFTLVLRNPSARSAARYDRLAAYAAYRGEPLTPATPMPPLAQDAGTAVEVAGWHSMYARCDLLLGVRKAVGNNGAGGGPQQAPLLGDPACNVDM